MKYGHKIIRDLLKDYCEYYFQSMGSIGYPNETIEAKLITTGIKRRSAREFNSKGVFVGKAWQSNKETKLPGTNKIPGYIKNWGSNRLRTIGIIVADMPEQYQKVIRAIFHPDRDKSIRNIDYCDILNISYDRLNRIIADIYKIIAKKLKIELEHCEK